MALATVNQKRHQKRHQSDAPSQQNRVEFVERVTAADFLKVGPEDRKAELIDGIIIEPLPPLLIHERLQRFLYTLLIFFIEEKNLGEVLGSRTPVVLSESYAPEPDILFVANDGKALSSEMACMVHRIWSSKFYLLAQQKWTEG